MSPEEVVALRDEDDAFVLAQAEENDIDGLIDCLEMSETEVQARLIHR